MNLNEKYLAYCLDIAKKGFGKVAPNPMVGCVIVHQNEIIGEGYHQQYGEAHAEVNAINSVADKDLLKSSTLYVNLEPCAHFGKTPPCSDLIIEHKIPKVVVGCIDTFSEVSGKGIAKMEDAGIEVIVGVLEEESVALNKRFFTFHHLNRPYIILKWAQTQDGFIDVDRAAIPEKKGVNVDNWITCQEAKQLVHQWRSEEQGIMVGTNTALNDDPELTVREVEGNNPLRIVLDLKLRLPENLKLFDRSTPTLVINYEKNAIENNLEYVQIDPKEDLLTQVMNILYDGEIQSVIVEGGAQLLQTFIDNDHWDEARVFTGKKEFKSGIAAPCIQRKSSSTYLIGTDELRVYIND